MNTTVRSVIGTVLAVLGTVAVVAVSRVPLTAEPSEHGALRLAWRYRSERVQQCRKLTPEEQAKLPAHMRRTEECERRLRPFRLEVHLDGAARADDTVRAAGAESDRPLYVFREFRLGPGRHAARITFTPIGESSRVPLVVDTSVIIAPRQVVLVTLDVERGVLVVRDR